MDITIIEKNLQQKNNYQIEFYFNKASYTVITQTSVTETYYT